MRKSHIFVYREPAFNKLVQSPRQVTIWSARNILSDAPVCVQITFFLLFFLYHLGLGQEAFPFQV